MRAGHKAVFGIYRDPDSLEETVAALKAAGYASSDLSVLFKERPGTKNAAVERQTKAFGEAAGTLSRGALNWLTNSGRYEIAGLGPLIAAGPIMSALENSPGGVTSGIAGTLFRMGVPEFVAKQYETRVKQGGILLSVHTGNVQLKKRAREIMESTGAEDIGMEEETRAA